MKKILLIAPTHVFKHKGPLTVYQETLKKVSLSLKTSQGLSSLLATERFDARNLTL